MNTNESFSNQKRELGLLRLIFPFCILIVCLLVVYFTSQSVHKVLYGTTDVGFIANFIDLKKMNIEFLILGTGVFFSLVIFLLTLRLSIAQNKEISIENDMTRDLMTYKLAIDDVPNHVVITDHDGKIIYANRSAESTTGYTFAEMKGNSPRLWGKQMSLEFYQKLWRTVKEEHRSFTGLITNRRKNGQIYQASVIISPIVDGGRLVGFIGLEQDISERINNENKLKERTNELERLNDLMVDRELKMIELKQQLKTLKERQEQNAVN